MNLFRCCASAAMAMLALANPAQAAEPERFYVAINAGRAELTAADDFLDQSAASNFSVRGGWQFSRYFAIEAGYIDLGDISGNAGGPYCFEVAPGVPMATPPLGACQATSRTEASGVLANFRGSLPLGERFAVSAFAGLTYLDIESRESMLVPTAPLGAPCCFQNIETRRGEGHDTAPSFGLSLSWRAFGKVELTADWTYVLGVAVLGDEVLYPVGGIDQPIYGRGLEGDGDYETWSVGVRVRF